MTTKILATIIIRTLAEEHRFAGLQRAIASIRQDDQDLENLTISVVVNGKKADKNILRWLNSQKLDILIIPEASLPLAFLKGISAVRTPYFGFLDDDDEYITGALDIRISAMEIHPDWDAVVTNGYKCHNGTDTLALTRLRWVTENPLLELFRENWIGSCTSLFRTQSFPEKFFEKIPHYLEWSYIGFKLAFEKKTIGVIDEPTFRINDTPGSASKSQAYQDTHINFYRHVLTHHLPADVVSEVQTRLQDAWALRALYAMHAKQFSVAQNSLREVAALPKFWRYAPLALRVAATSLMAKFAGLYR